MKIHILEIISLVVLVIFMACEYYAVFSERIYVLSISTPIKIEANLGIFQQCVMNECVWFSKENSAKASG